MTSAASAPFTIRIDDLRGPEVAVLLEEHLAEMRRFSPPGSVHALDLDALRAPAITFWTVWRGDDLAGCGALKELDATHGEIKSMRTAAGSQRQGVASMLVEHILAVAKSRGYRRVSLETGSGPPFAAAHALYARHGFVRCPPFAQYVPDSFSTCMTLELE